MKAQRFAGLFGGVLRAVHAVEPVPVLPEVPPLVDTAEFTALSHERLAQDIWPLLGPGGGAHRSLRRRL
ncbi:MAG: hypothetical protein HYS40_09025 [Gemmatimonadetes bacterium]|nr:hypothetical protein [Gemmatimonadota bacterium]